MQASFAPNQMVRTRIFGDDSSLVIQPSNIGIAQLVLYPEYPRFRTSSFRA